MESQPQNPEFWNNPENPPMQYSILTILAFLSSLVSSSSVSTALLLSIWVYVQVWDIEAIIICQRSYNNLTNSAFCG